MEFRQLNQSSFSLIQPSFVKLLQFNKNIDAWQCMELAQKGLWPVCVAFQIACGFNPYQSIFLFKILD